MAMTTQEKLSAMRQDLGEIERCIRAGSGAELIRAQQLCVRIKSHAQSVKSTCRSKQKRNCHHTSTWAETLAHRPQYDDDDRLTGWIRTTRDKCKDCNTAIPNSMRDKFEETRV